MIAFVIAVSLSLVVTNGMGSMKCGFKIKNARGCYLNAGHFLDDTHTVPEQAILHSLDSYWEYNAMWQCSGNTAGRIWYFEGGKADSRLFSILPDRNNQYQEFFLDTDDTEGDGIDVNENEFNAKVDRVSSRNIGYVTGGTIQSGWYILVIRDSAGKMDSALQGGSVGYTYDLVTGARVTGYEAKFEKMADDYGKKADNAIQLIAYPCGVKTGTSDIDPIIDPIIDPMPGNNPDPSSYVLNIQVSAQSVTYIIVPLSVLCLVIFFCFCSWKKSSGKVNCKRVKYDSVPDAV